MDRRSLLKYSFSGMSAATLLGSGLSTSFLDNLKSRAEDLVSPDNDETYWEMVKNQFSFEKGLYYFNNASLGPSPNLVVDATNEFRALLDGFPSKYMWGGWKEEVEATRLKAATMFGADAEEIALIHNTTEGMNLIASSMDLKPGDEVILSDHEHTSAVIPWQYWQETKGIKLVRPTLPILPNTEDEIVELYRKTITPRTKVISMVHGTNTNGMILPVKAVSKMAHEKGILVGVDAAQTGGTFQIDLHDMDCDFYAACGHKFMYSPKGMGVFYAKKKSQKHLKPLIVSRPYYTDDSIRRLENYNSRNYPELLGLGAAIDFYNLIGGEKREKRLYELKHYLRDSLDDDKFVFKTPGDDAMSCAIHTIEVKGSKVTDVKNFLFDNYKIDCRPMSSHGLNGVRISLSAFITKADVDYLVRALKEI
jgi:selenocysteine lyase/cysteine desulfurase